ncbi:MAG: hypothetical protein FVQ82_11925 [Planctomycetes bacterium]|nr:hypothetical protein [Planctomycetota bacterium]
MDVVVALPIILLLAAGMLTLIIYAIANKKWALLFIPFGLVVVSAGFWYTMMPSSVEVQYDRTTDVHLASAPADPYEHDGNSDRPARAVEYNTDSNIKVTRTFDTSRQVHSSEYAKPSLLIVTLLALIGLVVLIIIAITRKKWAVLLIPLGVAGLALLGIFFVHFADVPAPSDQVTETATTLLPADNARDKPLPAVWSPGIEKDFQADVYFSRSAALRGIAARADKKVREMALNGHAIPKKLALLTYKDQFADGLIEEAVGIFQNVLPDTECYAVAAGKESFTQNDSWVSMELTESPGHVSNIRVNGRRVNTYLNDSDFSNGNFKAAIHLKKSSSSFSVRFTEKPWLDNFSAFQNTCPQRQLAIAYSQTACNSFDWAVRQATRQAQQIVNRMILDIHRSMPKSGRSRAGFSLSRQELYQHGIVVDNFQQSFTGSAAPIYRHALLLDVSPDRIMPLAKNKIRRYNIERQSWTYHILSAIGIALVICVIYLILNAATRGYYTAVLRILTIVGIIVVVVVLLKLA